MVTNLAPSGGFDARNGSSANANYGETGASIRSTRLGGSQFLTASSFVIDSYINYYILGL